MGTSLSASVRHRLPPIKPHASTGRPSARRIRRCMMFSKSDARDPKYTPSDVQELWSLTPGLWNSYRKRDQVPSTVVMAGKLRYSRFSMVQLAQFGVQLELVKQFELSHEDAKKLAAHAAIEFEQVLIRPLGEEMPRMPFVIVRGNPPHWFRAG